MVHGEPTDADAPEAHLSARTSGVVECGKKRLPD